MSRYTQTLFACLVIVSGFIHCDTKETSDRKRTSTRPDFSLTVSDPVSVTAGQDIQIPVVITRQNGFAESIALSLGGGLHGIDASFAPAETLGNSSILTLTVSQSTTPQTVTYFVQGKSTNIQHAAAINVEILPIQNVVTISGKVVDLGRQPVSAVAVHIDGVDTATDGEGRFEITGVAPPYNVVVRRYGPDEIHIYKGLTRVDPILQLTNLLQTGSQQTTIAGNLTGGNGYPQSPNTITVVGFASTTGFGSTVLFPSQGPSYGPLLTAWYGSSGDSGVLYALQWTFDESLLPISYTGYTTQTVDVVNGTPSTNVNLTLTPVQTTYISGDITVAPGYQVESKTLWVQLGNRSAIPILIDGSSDLGFTYASPATERALGLQVATTSAGRRSTHYIANIAPGTLESFAPPAAPIPTFPLANQTDITPSTLFSWVPYQNSVHVLTMTATSAPTFVVYTGATTTDLHDLVDINFPLPAATAYTWNIIGVGAYDNLDAFASTDGGVHFFGHPSDVFWGESEAVTFSTQ